MATLGPEASQPVYPVGGRLFSLLDLLREFIGPEGLDNGVPRRSDLHLKVGHPACFRTDGDLAPIPDAPPLPEAVVTLFTRALIGERAYGAFIRPGAPDVDAGCDWPEGGASFRINAFHDREGPAVAIRVLPRWIPPLDSIGFPDPRVQQIIAEADRGLVIVTGITGSGKSTTIASFLQEIAAQRPVRIITLEDPIEYVLPSRRALVSQRELGTDVPTFSAGLRSALREDPDIIYVGEIRDMETASLALTAAETGHLVFSTLHTRDVRGAITRLLDLFPSDRIKELQTQLSFALGWIIGQRLVTRADGGGRRAVFEILRNTVGMGNLLRMGTLQQVYSSIETQQREGMITLERHLVELVRQNQISEAEAMVQANDPAIVQRLLRP